jgi:lysyl-tRNA synthetase class 1
LKKEDEERLKQRVEHVRYWLDNFAPEQVKFEVQKNIPNITLTKEQKAFLSSLYEKIPNTKWESEDIHNLIYSVSEEKKIQIKIAFQTIYQVILGKEKGPRAGYFLSNLDKDFVLKRFKEAVK